MVVRLVCGLWFFCVPPTAFLNEVNWNERMNERMNEPTNQLTKERTNDRRTNERTTVIIKRYAVRQYCS